MGYVAVWWLLLICTLSHGTPNISTIDNEAEAIYIQMGTAFDADVAEERARGVITVQGTGLVNGMKFAFSTDCTLSADDVTSTPMILSGVEEDPLSFFYQKQGTFSLTTNQTQFTFINHHICYTTDALSTTFIDTGLTVTVFEIFSIAGMTSIPDQNYRKQIKQIRAYQYSTVVYVVEGVGLADHLLLSLQYSCKNNGLLPPEKAATPAALYGTNADQTRAYVQFSHAQTDIPFGSKDLCVSRGNAGMFDFSGFTGNTMTVFADCIEQSCAAGSCHSPSGNCLCWNSTTTAWDICKGDNRNVTASLNLTVPPDPPMCRDIKLGHYAPDKTVNQMYLINPTGNDRFPVFCDMTDGGWASIPNTYAETQQLFGGQPAQWLSNNVSYNISLQRMEDIRNRSLYSRQDAIIACQASYADFSCRRAPYHVVHEAIWLQWNSSRLWPVYVFDGCCFGCCQQSTRPRTTLAQFWSLGLPIRNVQTYYAGADDNSETLRVDMQPVEFY